MNKLSPAFFVACPTMSQAKPQLTKSISVGEGVNKVTYKLKGIIYFSSAHFTCRIVDKRGHIFYHDGITTGRHCRYEGLFGDISNLHQAEGRQSVAFIYSRL
jgi:hypothetical protein